METTLKRGRPAGFHISEETRKKISLAHIGKVGYWAGKKRELSPEHIDILKQYSYTKGENGGWEGRQHTKESREKMSESAMGRVFSPETLQKFKETHIKLERGEFVELSKHRKKQQEKAGRPIPKQCEICFRGGKIVYDHSHETDKFRGWICSPCNKALGFVQDNPEILKKMINYLTKAL